MGIRSTRSTEGPVRVYRSMMVRCGMLRRSSEVEQDGSHTGKTYHCLEIVRYPTAFSHSCPLLSIYKLGCVDRRSLASTDDIDCRTLEASAKLMRNPEKPLVVGSIQPSPVMDSAMQIWERIYLCK